MNSLYFFRFGVIFGVDDRWMKCFTESEARGKTFHPAVINSKYHTEAEKIQTFIAIVIYFRSYSSLLDQNRVDI